MRRDDDPRRFLGFFDRLSRDASRQARERAEELSRPRGIEWDGGMEGVPPLDAHIDGGHTGPARVSRNREDRFNRNGSGGRIISRHRTKSAAVSKARKEARKRNTSFRVQDTKGRWSQGPGYG